MSTFGAPRTTGSAPPDLTGLLLAWRQGDAQALEQLVPLVYGELRRMASRYMRRERAPHTLQPTALVHEAFLRLVDQRQVTWQNRAHFFGVAAQLMRRLLVDHARTRLAAKRGGEMPPLSLGDIDIDNVTGTWDTQVLAVDEALGDLAALDARQGRIVELRFFGGLTFEETAEVLSTSATTVRREWVSAKAWLYRALEPRRS